MFILLCVGFFAHAQTEKELFDKGVSLFKQGEYQQAVDEFSKLIQLAPDNADAYKNRGVSYMKQEKFDSAIQDFETAKRLFPELKGLYSNLGVAWYYKKEYEKAIENYDLEIEMAPENHVAYFNRALCLAELGRTGQALSDLEHTLKLNPDFYWALCYQADLLAQEGKDLQAVEAYEAAVALDPKNTYATGKLARLREKLKDADQKDPKAQQENKKQPPRKKQKPAPSPAKGYALQAGAFLNQANAEGLKDRLIQNNFDAKVLVLKDSRDRTWYVVRSGNYSLHKDAEQAAVSLKEKLAIKSLVRPAGEW